jgi:hypothetical protein
MEECDVTLRTQAQQGGCTCDSASHGGFRLGDNNDDPPYRNHRAPRHGQNHPRSRPSVPTETHPPRPGRRRRSVPRRVGVRPNDAHRVYLLHRMVHRPCGKSVSAADAPSAAREPARVAAYETYATVFSSFEAFQSVFQQIATPHDYGCMVVCNRGATNRLQDHVKFYHARIWPEFRMECSAP